MNSIEIVILLCSKKFISFTFYFSSIEKFNTAGNNVSRGCKREKRRQQCFRRVARLKSTGNNVSATLHVMKSAGNNVSMTLHVMKDAGNNVSEAMHTLQLPGNIVADVFHLLFILSNT